MYLQEARRMTGGATGTVKKSGLPVVLSNHMLDRATGPEKYY